MKKSLLSKITSYSVLIFLGAILSAVVICTLGNIHRTVNLTTNITKSATRIVSQIAGKYDMSALAQAPDSAEYRELRATLRSICNSDGVEYIYIYIPDMDNDTLTYVIGVASDERKDKGTLETFQAGEVMEHQFSDGEKNAWSGKTEDVSSVRDSARYGRQMCTFACITDQSQQRMALVGADYSIDKIYREIISDTALKMLKVFAVLLGIFLVFIVFIKKKIYDPIIFLFHTMKNYVSNKTDDSKTFEPIQLDTNDEIQHLADYFNEMVVDIDQYADRVKTLASQQVRADTELEVARRIQYGIVDKKKDICLADHVMISARMESARWVGGDFYDSFRLKNGNVCVFIGDVSGKGIAAALFMVFVRTLMREKLMDISDLVQAVGEINREICDSNPEGMFVTSFIAVFEPNSDKFHYVNAGHNTPVMIHDGKAEFLTCSPCIALGVFDDSEYEQGVKKITSGDIVYLYTDGVTEAINSRKEFFGEENLLNACMTSAHTASEVCANVGESLKKFIGDNMEQFDDITMLAVELCDVKQRDQDRCVSSQGNEAHIAEERDAEKLHDRNSCTEERCAEEQCAGEPRDMKQYDVETCVSESCATKACTVELELSCDLSELEKIKEYIFLLPENDSVKKKIFLACEEIFSNIVNYSGADRIQFYCEKDEDKRTAVFMDTGKIFNPLESKIEKDFEDFDEGGMGIMLVKELCSDINYRRVDGKNILGLEFF